MKSLEFISCLYYYIPLSIFSVLCLNSLFTDLTYAVHNGNSIQLALHISCSHSKCKLLSLPWNIFLCEFVISTKSIVGREFGNTVHTILYNYSKINRVSGAWQ